VRPDTAVFGQKDAQQLVLVRRMSADFGLGIEIEAVPTVRAADGLALSSRNKYLSGPERDTAPLLHRALSAGAAAAQAGPGAVLAAAQAVLDDAAAALPPGSSPRVDYLALVDARSYAPVRDDESGFHGAAILAVAARAGTTRLIDNVVMEIPPHAADD
jgi:pantoate--beta-alanine ligase